VQALGDKVEIPAGQTTAPLRLINLGYAKAGIAEPFALLGTSARIPADQLPGPGANFAVVDLQAIGARLVGVPASLGGLGLQVAVSTWGIRAHPSYPAELDVYLDVNADGVQDFVMYTAENGTFASTGQTLVNIANLATGAASAYFFADTDLESGNVILTMPLAPFGISAGSKIGISVLAFDNYFTGNLTDSIDGRIFTPSLPKYDVTAPPAAGVDPLSAATLTVMSVPGGDAASPSQSGLLFFYRNANKGLETDVIEVVQH
jgi:hypothetical protein